MTVEAPDYSHASQILAPILRVRPMARTDADAATEMMRQQLPISNSLSGELPQLLRRLIHAEIAQSIVIEQLHVHTSVAELVAFGLSGFLHRVFVQKFLAKPIPYLELVVLNQTLRRAAISDGALLPYDEIARQNKDEGLILFPLVWLQKHNDLTKPEAIRLLAIGQRSLLDHHRGYQLQSIIKTSSSDRAQAHRDGGFRELCCIASGTPLDHDIGYLEEEQFVFGISREDVETAIPGKPLGQLFIHQPPRCGFTRAQKQVLKHALDGLTDQEISSALRLTLDSVQNKLRQIYIRVQERGAPLIHMDDDTEGKRRRVIEFVRQYPEELRPYPPSPRRARRIK